MKFQKFVKSIGSEGIIYERKNGERWLASDNVFMRIPEDIRSITASEIAPIPEAIENIINYESFTDPCELHKAVMPYADGVSKTVCVSTPRRTLRAKSPFATVPMLSLSARTPLKCTSSSTPRRKPAKPRLS